MFSKLSTKMALHKAGLGNLDFSVPTFPSTTTKPKGKGVGTGTEEEATGDWTTKNPFPKITVPKSLIPWTTPPPAPIDVAPALTIGGRAPTCQVLRMPYGGGKGVVVVFLRCCGCPFAEQTFLTFRTLANKHPTIPFLAISSSSSYTTQKWLAKLGGAWNVTVLSDPTRQIYAEWGLGISNSWHVLNPWTQVAQRNLGTKEGIWARRVDGGREGTEGTRGDAQMDEGHVGSRWVIGGAWVVDGSGIVRWGGAMKTADDIPKFGEGVEVLMRG